MSDVFRNNKLKWLGHILRKGDKDWIKNVCFLKWMANATEEDQERADKCR